MCVEIWCYMYKSTFLNNPIIHYFLPEEVELSRLLTQE